MKLSCPTCNAKYSISDERFAGRRVTVRCRQCGERFPADLPTESAQMCDVAPAGELPEPAEPAPAADPPKGLVGERNETSVLFSLATLARTVPPPTSPAAPENDGSSLIDLRALSAAMADKKENAPSLADDIAHLGGIGGASLFETLAAHVPADPPHDALAARRTKLPFVIASAALVALAAAGVAIVARPPPSAHASAEIPAAVASPVVAPPVASPSDDPPPASAPSVVAAPSPRSVPIAIAAPVRAPAHPQDAHDVTPPPPPTRTAAVATPKCCPGESETTCQVRLSVGAPCGNLPPSASSTQAAPPFDRPSALRALAIDVAGCKRADGPTGPGHVRVTFQPSGAVSAVDVAPPFSGTASGACVAQRYRATSVPAFSGGALTVGKSFTIP
jgi:predicted Zn finger-like uncharacterized protein